MKNFPSAWLSFFDYPIFSDATHSNDSQSDSVLSPAPTIILKDVKPGKKKEPPVPMPKTFDTSVIHNIKWFEIVNNDNLKTWKGVCYLRNLEI